jgi:hypothetical protein
VPQHDRVTIIGRGKLPTGVASISPSSARAASRMREDDAVSAVRDRYSSAMPSFATRSGSDVVPSI